MAHGKQAVAVGQSHPTNFFMGVAFGGGFVSESNGLSKCCDQLFGGIEIMFFSDGIGAGWGQRIHVLTLSLFVVFAVLAAVSPARASLLITPSAGTPDSALGGAGVARPITPEAAAFSNPAGFAEFDEGAYSLSLGFVLGSTSLQASAPPGYGGDHNFVGLIPGVGGVLKRNGDFTFGLAMYGSVGASFDFSKDPELGIDEDFFSELSVVTLAPTVAWKVSDRLNLGASITPLFGYLRLRFPAGFPFKYTMRGPGIQAMFGAQYHVDDRLSLGLGVRTPGIIFMDGSGPTPEGRRDMDLQIRMPAQVFVGASFDVTPTVELAVSGRWTDSSTLGASLIRVGGFDQLTTPLVPDANDEFRGAVGVTWAVAPKWKLRTGIGYADGIVGDDGASPLLFDVGADVKITSGISYDRGPWTFDVTAGYNFEEHREIDGEEALLVPGHYEASGGVLFLGLRRGLN